MATYTSTEGNSSNVQNHYPADILSAENKYRHIRIIVKNLSNSNLTVDNAVAQLTELTNKVKDAITERGSSDRNNPSDAATQNNLKSRTAKIIQEDINTLYGIALPLPNELNDSQSHQWEQSDGVVSTVVNSLIEKVGLGSVNKAIGNVTSQLGMRKPLINPGYFQDYKGTDPREFSFSWDLIPNNVQEVDNIMHILYNLKKYTLPQSDALGSVLLSPYLFDIQLGNTRINNLMNMNNVVCKSMNINYAAEGSLQFLPDGMPKHIKLEMTFAERALVTSDFY